MQLKVRKIGHSLGTIWPKDVLARLNVKEGDRLSVIETTQGFMVTPYDPQFQKSMENTDKVIRRFRNAYKELARR